MTIGITPAIEGHLFTDVANSARSQREKDVAFGHETNSLVDDSVGDAREVIAPILQGCTSQERPFRSSSIPAQNCDDFYGPCRLDVKRLLPQMSTVAAATSPSASPAKRIESGNMPLIGSRRRRVSSSNSHILEAHKAVEQGKARSRKPTAVTSSKSGRRITPAPIAAATLDSSHLLPLSNIHSTPEHAYLSPSLSPLSSSMSSSSSMISHFPASPDLLARDHCNSKEKYSHANTSFNNPLTGSSDSRLRPPPSRWCQHEYRTSQIRQTGTSSDDRDKPSSSSEHILDKREQAFAALTGQKMSVKSKDPLFSAMSQRDLHSSASIAWLPFMVPPSDSLLKYEVSQTPAASPMLFSADSSRRTATNLGGRDTPRTSFHFAESPQCQERVLSAGADASSVPKSNHLLYCNSRRSLSKDDSLLATRIASAFLAKELGEHVLQRRSASIPPDQWPVDQTEQRDLWLALVDGVSLCRLLNRMVPVLDLQPMHEDTATARQTNITLFLAQAKVHLPLEARDYFRMQDLSRGNPGTFDRVVHMICAIAEIIANSNASIHRAAPSHGSNVDHHSESAADGCEQNQSSRLRDDIDRGSKKTSLPGTSRIPLRKGKLASLSTNRRPSWASPPSASTVDLTRSINPSDSKSGLSRSRIIRSSTGSAICVRTKPRVCSTPSPPLCDDRHVMLSKSLINADPTWQQPSPLAPGQPRRQSIYGKHSDKRASVSAVDVMAVLLEGTEAPRPRRSVSDRPQLITATMASSDSASSVSWHPLATSTFRQSNEDKQPLSEVPAPLLIPQSKKAPVLRTTSPLSNASRPTSLQATPFPCSGSEGHAATGSQDGGSQEFPASLVIRSTVDLPTLVLAQSLPIPMECPRQHHKRWNSDVYDNSPHQARVFQSVDLSRARHDSCDPPAHRVQRTPRPGHRLPDEAGKRCSASRPNSADISRDRIIVRDVNYNMVVYQLGESIGRGQFGSVYRGLNIESGSVVAVKRIRIENKLPEQVCQLQKEVELLKRLAHPAVVRYEGSALSNGFINIVLEYVENGSLLRTLASFGPLGEDLIAAIVLQILDGLAYLHGVNVIHRDLKCANILSTKSGNIKLTDFGVSLQTDAVKETMKNLLPETATGTPYWMAPEVITMDHPSYPSDIWSLGCVIVELLTGQPPYSNYLPLSAMYQIAERDMPIPHCSELMHDFLLNCFAKDPESRPTARDLFNHPWLILYRVKSKMLRAQDSIPFLRRMATECPVSDGRHGLQQSSDDGGSDGSALTKTLDQGRAPAYKSHLAGILVAESGSPQTESTSHQGRSEHPDSPLSSHTFVESQFSRAIGCKVCHQVITKYALVCELCGIICHIDCAINPLNTCDPTKHLWPTSPPAALADTCDHTSELSSSLLSPVSFVVRRDFAEDRSQPPITLEPAPTHSKARGSKRPQTSTGAPPHHAGPIKAGLGFNLYRSEPRSHGDAKQGGRRNKLSHGNCVIA